MCTLAMNLSTCHELVAAAVRQLDRGESVLARSTMHNRLAAVRTALRTIVDREQLELFADPPDRDRALAQTVWREGIARNAWAQKRFACPGVYSARGVGPMCCLPPGHEGPHRYKCANPKCEGLAMPASESAHAHPVSLDAHAPTVAEWGDDDDDDDDDPHPAARCPDCGSADYVEGYERGKFDAEIYQCGSCLNVWECHDAPPDPVADRIRARTAYVATMRCPECGAGEQRDDTRGEVFVCPKCDHVWE